MESGFVSKRPNIVLLMVLLVLSLLLVPLLESRKGLSTFVHSFGIEFSISPRSGSAIPVVGFVVIAAAIPIPIPLVFSSSGIVLPIKAAVVVDDAICITFLRTFLRDDDDDDDDDDGSDEEYFLVSVALSIALLVLL